MDRPALLNSFIGEYRLVDFLGAGGMGEVYRAVHSKIGRVVAIKVLTHAGHSSNFAERFLNEARIHASLQHEKIVTFYEFFYFDGRPCIIMEYVDGQTLAERIRLVGLLSLSETVLIFQAVVEAINYIHSHGIVHRDIKSNNIKISSTGQVKLLDFGIAKGGSTPKLTVTGDVIGTLQYLSPEQLKGGVADARSDIWALGVLLYEMVTGRVPFEAATIGELYEKISKASYTPPSVLNLGAPQEVEAIISRCLKKNPSDRYQSAQQLLRDTARLAAAVATPHLGAINNEKVTTGKKAFFAWEKSNRLILSAVAAILLIIAVFYIFAPTPEPTEPLPKPSGLQPKPTEPPPKPTEMSIEIDVFGGRAGVYRNGRLLGSTPYQLKTRPGERIDLALKRDGFIDKQVEFSVTENRKVYTFSMEKKE